jgi:hypothetical protein
VVTVFGLKVKDEGGSLDVKAGEQQRRDCVGEMVGHELH